MNRPSFAARVAGSPMGSLVIWVGCAALVFGWYAGHVHWWMGVAAIAGAMRTRTAKKSLRRYEAWAAEWQAMGEDDAPAPPLPSGPRRGAGRRVITVAALLVPVLPLLAVNTTGSLSDGLIVVWFLDCLFLVVALVRAVAHRFIGRPKTGKVGVMAEAEPVVTCLVPPASPSPSRADAVRDLPGYCARLIERGRA